MIDRYFEFLYYRDVVVPTILAVLAIVVILIMVIISLWDKWNERKKK